MKKPVSIIEFVESPRYLGDGSLSTPQRAALKGLYGLEMTPDELAAYVYMSEGRPPRPGGYDVASLGIGRRSGKTEKIAANVAVYEAVTFDPEGADKGVLAPGETAYVVIIAQNKKNARVARDYCEAKLEILEKKGYAVLAEPVGQRKAVVSEEIRLCNRVTILILPCKKVAVRSIFIFCALLDEIGHWQTEDDAYNADRAILKALRPCMAQARRRKLVKVSTPFTQAGVFWNEFENRARSRQMVLHQVATEYFNPSIDREFLHQEQEEDPDGYVLEYLARWGGVQGGYITGGMVDACTITGRIRVSREELRQYEAACDVAFKKDLFAWGIGSARMETADRLVVVLNVLQWRKPPGPGRPLDEDTVLDEVVADLQEYRLDTIEGDQYASIPVRNGFRARGVQFVEVPLTAELKYRRFSNLRALMTRTQIELPHDPVLRRDLTSLQRTRLPGGLVRIAAPDLVGYHDDLSIVVSTLALKFLEITVGLPLQELNAEADIPRDVLGRRRPWGSPAGEGEVDELSDFGLLDEVY